MSNEESTLAEPTGVDMDEAPIKFVTIPSDMIATSTPQGGLRVVYDQNRLKQILDGDSASQVRYDDERCAPDEACYNANSGWLVLAGVIVVGLYFVGQAIASVLANLLRGTWSVDRNSFPNLPGDDHDNIEFDLRPGQQGFFTLTLRSALNVTWFKGAEIHDVRGGSVGPAWGAWTENASHERTIQVPNGSIEEMGGWVIVLVKSKVFGVHTPMYTFYNLREMADQHITLNWTSD